MINTIRVIKISVIINTLSRLYHIISFFNMIEIDIQIED